MQEIAREGRRIELLNHLALRCRVTLSVGTVERSLQANQGGTRAPWKGLEQMEVCLNGNCFDLGF